MIWHSICPLGPENCTLSGEVDAAGHRATVTVHSPGLPAGGANRLSLETDLVMRLGHGEEIVEQKNVNLKAGTITVGPSPLIVMIQEPVDGIGQGNGTQVILFHQGPIRRARRDQEGRLHPGPDASAEIQTRGSGSGQSGSVYQAYYSLTRRVETLHSPAHRSRKN